MKSRNSAKLNRLDDMTIRRLVKAGAPDLHNDGGGLNLKITGPATASWVFRYKINKRERNPGLGPYPTITLAAARDRAQQLRKLLADGIDPLEHRNAVHRQVELDRAKAVTLDHCVQLWLELKRKSCTSLYVNDLERRLRKHACRVVLPGMSHSFGELPVKEINTTLALQVLEPIWTTIPVTADHWVRASLEEILDLAKHRDYRDRDSENPFRWTKHLEYILPAIADFHAVAHRKPLPYVELPTFMTVLQNWDKQPGAIRRDGTLARCLRFMILTTTRPGEAAGARWEEIDWKNRVWNIPAERMKGRRPHSVPLSDQAMQILYEQHERAISSPRLFTPLGRRIRAAVDAHGVNSKEIAAILGCSQHMAWLVIQDLKSPPQPLGEFVFDRRPKSKKQPGNGVRAGRIPFTKKLLKKAVLVPMGYGHIDPHGLRSSYSTWCNEETSYVGFANPALRQRTRGDQADRVIDGCASCHRSPGAIL